MEKRVGLLCIALLLLLAGAAFAQQPFADVKTDHWAYGAVSDLQSEGVIAGYPDGYFRGNRMLSRYEFAQAIFRLKQVLKGVGPAPAGGVSQEEFNRLQDRVTALEGRGAGGLTPAQQALLRRLETEFAPELRALRADYDALAKRVSALEAAIPPPYPKITANGDIGIRGGVYGNHLRTGTTDTTGYPYPWFQDFGNEGPVGFYAPGLPYGAINLDIPGEGIVASIPVSDALKDAFKANQFLLMQAHVGVSAALNPNVDAMIRVRTNPRNNITIPGYTGLGDLLGPNLVVSPNQFYSDGLMDTATIEEAWVRAKTNFLAPVTVTAGKQYFAFGEGLLANNDQFALKSARADWSLGRRLRIGGLVGMFDREAFNAQTAGNLAGLISTYAADTTSGQDTYAIYYANLGLTGNWGLGFNWLASGFHGERGWSGTAAGRLFGVDLSAEYAKLDRIGSGADTGDEDAAWVISAGRTSKAFSWGVKYGEVEADYAFDFTGSGWDPVGPLAIVTSFAPMSGAFGYLNLPLSLLHPYAEFNPYDINWVDRPLFLDPTNVVRGWEGKLKLGKVLGSAFPVELRYYGGDAFTEAYLGWIASDRTTPRPTRFRKADSVWTVKVSHDIAKDVTASLLYGHRDAKHVLSPTPGVVDDAVQTVRAELSVGF